MSSLHTLEDAEERLDELREAGYVSDGDVDVDVRPDYSTCLIVEGLPVVTEAKYDKLLQVLKRIYGQLGAILHSDMPMDPATGKTFGTAFLELGSAQEVAKAVQTTNNYKLDAVHTLKVRPYSMMAEALAAPDKYEPPTDDDFPALMTWKSTIEDNLRSWLGDAKAREQYLLRFADCTEVHWCGAEGAPELDYDGHRENVGGQRWCKQLVQWSPRGSYLATFVMRGVALWGGSGWRQVSKFPHWRVQAAQFSPGESFMVTWDGRVGSFKDGDPVIVWDVRTGAKLRAFPFPEGATWPLFQWTANEKAMARADANAITVYEVPSMARLNKGPLQAPGMAGFAVAPRDSYFVYWGAEASNVPAHISIRALPSGREVRRKNLFNVRACELHWHNRADFLCVQVTRTSKSGKTSYTDLELFRMRDRDVPVESLELQKTDRVTAVAWEPDGTRLAVVHSATETRVSVSFYDMGAVKGGKKVEHLYTLTDRQCTHLHWSPAGRYLVLAGLGSPFNGTLEFVDVEERDVLAQAQHFMANEVHWDPSGRLLATAVTRDMFKDPTTREEMENGFQLWSMLGMNLYKQPQPHFFQFLWRPRPPLMLNDEEQEQVRTNLGKYVKRYKEEDKRAERRRRAEEMRERRAMRRKFLALMERRQRQWEAESTRRRELRGGYASDDEYEVVEEVVLEPMTTLSEKYLE